jgi:hypothetical protein
MKPARTLITICLLLTAVTLLAQTPPSHRLMTVSIPFAFGVGDQTLPSGKYIVLTVTPERSIRVVSSDGSHSAVVNTLPNYAQAPSENSRLVFHKYGPEYFLVEVWTAGENVARNPLPGKRAMDITSSAATPETRSVWSGRSRVASQTAELLRPGTAH